MSANPRPEPDRLEAAADKVIDAADGDVRAAFKTMIAANEQLQASTSHGFTRGSAPRERWYD